VADFVPPSGKKGSAKSELVFDGSREVWEFTQKCEEVELSKDSEESKASQMASLRSKYVSLTEKQSFPLNPTSLQELFTILISFFSYEGQCLEVTKNVYSLLHYSLFIFGYWIVQQDKPLLKKIVSVLGMLCIYFDFTSLFLSLQ
jgi:hypothetical protein